MNEYKGKIFNIEAIAKDTFRLIIKSNLQTARSGQFVSILCNNKTLRRPFSISDFEKISENESLLTVLFKVKGEGTEFLKNLKIDDKIDFLAPLGNGFNIKNKNSLLVGAGIGIAPMLFLKKELNQKSIKNILLAGFKNEDEVITGYDEVKIEGSVVDDIEKTIKEKNIEIIYACGPYVVLKLINEISKKLNIEYQVAMEKVMACGIGVCRGCVIKTIKNNKETISSICKDGPVFLSNEIIWE